MRDRVSIQYKSTTADGQGGRSTSWVELAMVAAQVLPALVGERMQLAAVGSTLSYIVHLRYRADITPSMRVQWTPYKASAAKTLEIHGVHAVDGGRQFTRLECAEVI